MSSDLPVEEIDLYNYWLILRRRWKSVISIFLLTVSASFLYAMREETTYMAEAKLIFKSDRATSLTGLGEALGRVESLTFQDNPLNTQVEIILSYPILDTVIQNLTLTDEDGQLIDPTELAEKLSVQPIPGTDIVSIAYQANDPKVAALVPNAIADVFIQENVQQNRAEATAARDFISQQLPQTEAALNQAETNLRQFKEKNQIVVLSEEASALVGAAFQLQNQINTVEAQIANLNSIVESYQAQLSIDDTQRAVVLAALSQSTGVQNALQDLQTVEQEIAANRALFTENSQAIVRLNTRRSNLESILRQRVGEVVSDRTFDGLTNLQIGDLQVSLIEEIVSLNAQKLGLQNQIDTLDQQMSRYNQRMLDLPSLERQQSQLERNLAVAQQTYQTLLSRFQELQVAESQNIGTARLISPAIVRDKPIPSSKKFLLVVGVVVGGLLGIASAFILDLLDGSIKTVKQAKEIFGYPALGVIPSISNEEKKLLSFQKNSDIPSLITRDLSFSMASEAYQILQVNLTFSDVGSSSKIIIVGSSTKQEGRSMVAANLAFSLSKTGNKVLLIDADFRSPIQHVIWDINNEKGLKNAVIDREEVDQIAQIVAPGLSVLPTGDCPSNPMVLLGSKHMASILPQLEHRYHYVIVDSPPLTGTADASVLAQLADGLLLVTRIGTIETSIAKQVKDMLVQSKIKVLGLVINDINIDNQVSHSIKGNSCEKTNSCSYSRT